MRVSDGHGIAHFPRDASDSPRHRASHVHRPPNQFTASKAAASMDVDDWNSPTTKLLTLLNVSAAKSSKRKFSDHQGSPTPKQKLNKRRVENLGPGNDDMETTEPEIGVGEQEQEAGVGEAADVSDAEGV